jgi:hypothetical protein
MRPIWIWRLFVAVVAVIAGVVAARLVPEPLPELTRAELMAEIQAGNVSRLDIEDQGVILGESTTRGAFRSAFDRRNDADLPAELGVLGVEVRFTRSPPGI